MSLALPKGVLAGKLVPVQIAGIYRTRDGLLPPQMAWLTPDAAAGLESVKAQIGRMGGLLRLSDCFRSREMQQRAHDDWRLKRKKAYSPPPGGSMHEAGRAIDIDLAALIDPASVPKGYRVLDEDKHVRAAFTAVGWAWISGSGNPHLVDVSESWHVEFRGAFGETYRQVRVGQPRAEAYKAMVKAAIADIYGG